MTKYLYQYRVWDVQKSPSGIIEYRMKETGELPIGDVNVRNAKIEIEHQATELARRTGKDVTVKIQFDK